ncbi:MAG TPA: ROK family protein [Pseudomonadales bacterium]
MGSNRIGIDLGGSKTEIIVLRGTRIFWRKRVATPSGSYPAMLDCLAELVNEARQLAPGAPVGIGMPGALCDGRVKNANTVCLNGQAFQQDIEARLGGPVRIMNDANCFALSEAIDGAGEDGEVVFGVILGTGVGGALVVNKQVLHGANAIAGEWGHNALCRRAPVTGGNSRVCYCGRKDCVETWLSGAGLAQTFLESCGEAVSGEQLSRRLAAGDSQAQQVFRLYVEQLAASLAVVINIADPDIIVLGGGLSQLPDLAEAVEARLPDYVFSPTLRSRVLGNRHGDASGVRGAAWLWP